MKIDPGAVDHAFVAAWVEHLKGVYQRALDSYAEQNQIAGGELQKIRNHLKALAMIQKAIAEHHEMARGAIYDAGDTGFKLRTNAVLVKPNGEVIQLRKRQ